MKRRAIFRTILAASVLGVTALASAPAMANLGDDAQQAKLPVHLHVMSTDREWVTSTDISVDGASWNWTHNRTNNSPIGPWWVPGRKNGTFSAETAADIQKLARETASMDSKANEDEALGKGKEKTSYALVVGDVEITYSLAGESVPEGNSAPAQLVRLLISETER
ncbi:MAG: hypothetical protein H0T78_09250 [Longispora sp.]|nr:hypothetical protein [Longispora sp. (in: high G+C Gram-positive bacteria)]